MQNETSVLKRTRSSSGALGSSNTSTSEQKRLRESFSMAQPDISTSNGVYAAKNRVNPESLATRLGPQLVSELEALLQPDATEMPPFHIRQAIQKRYNIDRRHIYDWFRSKGLRVTKDERRHATEENSAAEGPHAPVSVSFVKRIYSQRY